MEATREDMERQHEEVVAAVRDEYKKHIAQLQHTLKVRHLQCSINTLITSLLPYESYTSTCSLSLYRIEMKNPLC